jgi:hypothetical protein
MDVVKTPPWEALPYFELPVEIQIAAITAGVQVCPADPKRVLLIVSINGNSFKISTKQSNTLTSAGIFTSTTAGYLVISYEEWGILVNQAWFFTESPSPAPAAVGTVITVAMLDEIRHGNKDVKNLTLVQPPATPQRITTKPGVDGGQGLLDYWRKLVAKFGGK